MKKLIKTTCLFIAFLAIGQSTTSLKVTESAEFKDKERSEGVLAIHTTNSGKTGLVRGGRRDFLLDVFDSNLNKINSQLIESSKRESFYGYVCYGDEIKYITVEEPSKRERIIFCNTFDIESNKFNQKELFRADVEKGGLFTGRNKRETNISISPNGQYIAVFTDNEKKNLNSYMVHVFDSKDLKLIFKKSYQEHIENFFQLNDVFIDDEATVFTLGKLFIDGKSQKKGGEANYDFILNKLSNEKTENIKISLPEGNHIASLKISFHQNKINLIGFYSEKRAGSIKGGCNFQIDAVNLKVLNQKNTPLPKSVYEDLFGDSKAERFNEKKKELSSYYIDYVYYDEEGNSYILAEEFYITSTYVNTGGMGMGGGYYQTVYHYDDILILKFDPKGEVTWGRSIFKRSTFPSYNSFLKDNKLHVILNSGKNLTEKNDGRTKVSKGFFESTALYDINFNSNGDVKYDKIQDNRGNNYYAPNYGTYNNGKFILICFGKKKQFMTLE